MRDGQRRRRLGRGPGGRGTEQVVLILERRRDRTHTFLTEPEQQRALDGTARRFVERRLFKAIDLDMPENERAGFIEAARDVVVRGGFPAEYYFIEDRATDVPYYGYYTGEGSEPRARIYVEDGYARPRIREISEVSEVVRGLRGYELHRVCFPAEVKDQVYRLYHAPALAPLADSKSNAMGD